ncbi:TPA: TolC family protein, partial [Neisseria meningitidis]
MTLLNLMIMQDYGISVCLTLTPYLQHELFSAMKSYFSKYILPVSLFTLPLSLSPSVSAFTLPEAWRAAQQHSADFQASHYQRDAVRARQQQAKAAFLPHVSANASYQRQPPSISSTRET